MKYFVLPVSLPLVYVCLCSSDHMTHHPSTHSTNIFCDKYDSSQKTYCKRLRVLCPEHTKEPKVQAKLPNYATIFYSFIVVIPLFRSILMMFVGAHLIQTFPLKLRHLRDSVDSQRSRVSITTAGRNYAGQKSTKRNLTW